MNLDMFPQNLYPRAGLETVGSVGIVTAALVILDGVLVGFRAAAGKCGLISKQAYYRAAMRSGGLVAAAQLVFLVLVAVALAGLSSQPEEVWPAFRKSGAVINSIMVPYAAIALVALALYAIPSPSFRTMATVTVLGPFTMLRPAVIVAALSLAVYNVCRIEVIMLAGVSGASLLAFEPLFSRRYRIDQALLKR